jgi:hypothetical protein
MVLDCMIFKVHKNMFFRIEGFEHQNYNIITQFRNCSGTSSYVGTCGVGTKTTSSVGFKAKQLENCMDACQRDRRRAFVIR